jgi:hypothetical protein
MGGQLVSFGSLAEHKEVEDYFVGKGFLLPLYHKLYWLGLRTPAYKGDGSKSKFAWLDGATPAPSGTTYSRWGGCRARALCMMSLLCFWHAVLHAGSVVEVGWARGPAASAAHTDVDSRMPCAGTYNPNSVPEPNNLFGNEFCGVANYSQSVGQVASWSDTNCNFQFNFMCETKPPSIVVAPNFNASTGAIFAFNPMARTFDDAQMYCKGLGGHLAAYTSLQEQLEVRMLLCSLLAAPPAEPAQPADAQRNPARSRRQGGWPPAHRAPLHAPQVEGYYVNGGFLLPKYHRFYWIGLRAVGPKNFNWIDPTMPRLSAADSFRWWGMTKPDNLPEPNNYAGNELCAVGNYTEARKNAWGWADTGCTSQYVSICRMMGKRAAPIRPMNVAISSARIVASTTTNATFYFNATPVDYNAAGESRRLSRPLCMRACLAAGVDEQALRPGTLSPLPPQS